MADAFNALSERRIDLLCGAITINLSRRTLVDFSQPIFLTGASALLRTDSPRDLRELFLGERTISPPRSPQLRPFSISVVGARSGTTTEETLRRAIRDGEYETTVVDYDSHTEGLAALESRKIDAYFADRALLFSLSQQADDASDLVIGDRLLTHEAYGIAVRRDDPDFRLRVDRALSKFYRTDEFAKLLQTYFGNEAATIKADILARAIPD
jgi:ABC-type amino acid transport substrate-binding protein